MKVFTAAELRSIIESHRIWLSGDGGEYADLSSADLSSADLSSADLSFANLSSADLRFANLRFANLSSADLRSANLSFADLRSADLRSANLRSANLRSANLSFANLSFANLSSADLRSANLSSADFILVGQDIRGYLFYAYQDESGVVNIDAGCRHFVGTKAAREHWAARHLGDTILHEDIQSLLARCERMAEVRGWKLNSNSE